MRNSRFKKNSFMFLIDTSNDMPSSNLCLSQPPFDFRAGSAPNKQIRFPKATGHPQQKVSSPSFNEATRVLRSKYNPSRLKTSKAQIKQDQVQRRPPARQAQNLLFLDDEPIVKTSRAFTQEISKKRPIKVLSKVRPPSRHRLPNDQPNQSKRQNRIFLSREPSETDDSVNTNTGTPVSQKVVRSESCGKGGDLVQQTRERQGKGNWSCKHTEIPVVYNNRRNKTATVKENVIRKAYRQESCVKKRVRAGKKKEIKLFDSSLAPEFLELFDA